MSNIFYFFGKHIIDTTEYTLKQKQRWARRVAKTDNRWTKCCTEWQPRRGKRARGRPSRRWQDHITQKEETTWTRKATDRRQWKTLMEGCILQWMEIAQVWKVLEHITNTFFQLKKARLCTCVILMSRINGKCNHSQWLTSFHKPGNWHSHRWSFQSLLLVV